jgi:truncated hemoglobin YjbI
MLYRIFTEDVKENHDKLTELITQFYEGFTILKGQGYWRLQPENSLVIEIVTIDEDAKVKTLAAAIRDANNQECVLVQKIENHQWFV